MKFTSEKIKERRLELGMSRKALAEAAGITYNAVWRIETGQREPLAGTLATLANALRLKSVNHFFR